MAEVPDPAPVYPSIQVGAPLSDLSGGPLVLDAAGQPIHDGPGFLTMPETPPIVRVGAPLRDASIDPQPGDNLGPVR